jgi:hypothetical protein
LTVPFGFTTPLERSNEFAQLYLQIMSIVLEIDNTALEGRSSIERIVGALRVLPYRCTACDLRFSD